MIDVHCHLFTFDSVPEGYFSKVFLKRGHLNKIIPILEKIVPWSKNDRFSQLALFFKTGSLNSEQIFKRLDQYYPENSIFVPLMIDFEIGVEGPVRISFQEQLDQLLELKKKFPNRLYPFLAVDPRRENILQIVKENIDKQKKFLGIKLHPQLGYLPTHPVLMELFEYCEKRNIPITTHCAPFSPSSTMKTINIEGETHNGKKFKSINTAMKFKTSNEICEYFCNPVNWSPVLETFPSLRLNFAHFGGMEFMKFMKGKTGTWTDKIINFMAKYRNVYTDISYIVFYRRVYPMIKKMIHSSIGHKILFGTDKYIVLLEAHINQILNSCYVEFSPEELHAITVINPENFLTLSNTHQHDAEIPHKQLAKV